MFKLAALLLASVALAQTPRNVTLTWTDSTNPAGTGYNVYRAVGSCAGSPALVKVTATPLTAKTYTDSAISGGNTYCYAVTAVNATLESAKSQTAAAVVIPDLAPPTGLTTTVVTVTVTVTGP